MELNRNEETIRNVLNRNEETIRNSWNRLRSSNSWKVPIPSYDYLFIFQSQDEDQHKTKVQEKTYYYHYILLHGHTLRVANKDIWNPEIKEITWTISINEATYISGFCWYQNDT